MVGVAAGGGPGGPGDETGCSDGNAGGGIAIPPGI